MYIPAVVLGELFFGAAKSGRPSENIAQIDRFAAGRSVIASDLEVAREHGRLKQYLRQRGRPLPENDIWIGGRGNARHGMILVTRDRHFDEVEDLQTADWTIHPQ